MKSLMIALIIAALGIPALAAERGYGPQGQPRGGGAYRGYQDRGRVGGPGGGPGAYRGGYPPPRGYAPPLPYGGGEPFRGPRGWSAYAPPGGGAARWRRGQFFPPAYRGELVSDYHRYHLRRPPPGYYWYRSGDDFILAAVASGLIFEVVSTDGY